MMSQALWQDMLDQLETQRAQLIQEIRNYPPPIPACDVQFNYLLEQRDRLSAELNRLHELSPSDMVVDDLLHFAAASPFISAEAEQDIRSRMG